MSHSSLLADLMRPQTAAANLRSPQNHNGSLRPEAAANRKPSEKHMLESPANVRQSKNKNKDRRPKPIPAASTGSWQSQCGPLNLQVNAVAQPPQNHYGVHNELYQAGHMNDRIAQGNCRPPHDAKRNSSHGKWVWRPVIGNNPFETTNR